MYFIYICFIYIYLIFICFNIIERTFFLGTYFLNKFIDLFSYNIINF